MKNVYSVISVFFAVLIFPVSTSLFASELKGSFFLKLVCEDEIEISGEATFAVAQLEGQKGLQLLLHQQLNEGDIFSITLSYVGESISPGAYLIGQTEAITGFVTKTLEGVQLSGEVESGELTITESTESVLSGTLNVIVQLTSAITEIPEKFCSGGGMFNALPGPGDTPPIVAGSQACPDGPDDGTWTLMAMKMSVGGVLTPLGGGPLTGSVHSLPEGEKVSAAFSGTGALEFVPFDGKHEPLTGRLYEITKRPPGMDSGVYWYLSCDSPTQMTSTTGIVSSQLRGGPPHVQFHRWKFKN
jgi:hypothetical protein